MMKLRTILPLALAALCLPFALGIAAEPDASVLTFKLPANLKWDTTKKSGNQQIILWGDPTKPGEHYGILQKWHPNSMSRPHFHPNDRHIYVISGTWWLGWGTKYDPASTYPAPAGTYVDHLAKGIHYDGAKDEECILLITGIGPASSTNAEQK